MHTRMQTRMQTRLDNVIKPVISAADGKRLAPAFGKVKGSWYHSCLGRPDQHIETTVRFDV